MPVTIAWGEEDRLVAPPKAERMPSGTRYFSVPGWGHTPTKDDPEGVARVILQASEPQVDLPESGVPGERAAGTSA